MIANKTLLVHSLKRKYGIAGFATFSKIRITIITSYHLSYNNIPWLIRRISTKTLNLASFNSNLAFREQTTL